MAAVKVVLPNKTILNNKRLDDKCWGEKAVTAEKEGFASSRGVKRLMKKLQEKGKNGRENRKGT